MDIGKQVYELADRIIGRHLRQQFTLMNPSECHLVARHLHPYGVDRISRQRLDIGHHDSLMTVNGDRILLALALVSREFQRHDLRHRHIVGLLGHHNKRVACHNEVIVLRVMMGGIEGNRINLLTGEIPSVGSQRSAVVARDCKE